MQKNGGDMERKEVNAILSSEFEAFLKNQNLIAEFKQGGLHCDICNKEITSENIAIIFFDKKYKFICGDKDCLDKFNNEGLL